MSITALKSHLITLVPEEHEGVFPRPPEQCSLPVPFLLWRELWLSAAANHCGWDPLRPMQGLPLGRILWLLQGPGGTITQDPWNAIHRLRFLDYLYFTDINLGYKSGSLPDSQGNQRPNAPAFGLRRNQSTGSGGAEKGAVFGLPYFQDPWTDFKAL